MSQVGKLRLTSTSNLVAFIKPKRAQRNHHSHSANNSLPTFHLSCLEWVLREKFGCEVELTPPLSEK